MLQNGPSRMPQTHAASSIHPPVIPQNTPIFRVLYYGSSAPERRYCWQKFNLLYQTFTFMQWRVRACTACACAALSKYWSGTDRAETRVGAIAALNCNLRARSQSVIDSRVQELHEDVLRIFVSRA